MQYKVNNAAKRPGPGDRMLYCFNIVSVDDQHLSGTLPVSKAEFDAIDPGAVIDLTMTVVEQEEQA